ncbi:hypothetical protein NPIL_417821 [Nephila pilipes]|uniref:Uncharacterized protein n=1 Tax=Nephila pilipes TaxID=299642 RepID=A0A8X6N7S7_NEPPI|nr:hypothetical protein NPIL_417821 [Nephila pilipes]
MGLTSSKLSSNKSQDPFPGIRSGPVRKYSLEALDKNCWTRLEIHLRPICRLRWRRWKGRDKQTKDYRYPVAVIEILERINDCHRVGDCHSSKSDSGMFILGTVEVVQWENGTVIRMDGLG